MRVLPEDDVIGVKLQGGPELLDGWTNVYPADRLGGWPPPEQIAAVNVGGVVAVAIPDDVPAHMQEFVTLYRKIAQSSLAVAEGEAVHRNFFRGATYEVVQ
jgi:hypothetical protein